MERTGRGRVGRNADFGSGAISFDHESCETRSVFFPGICELVIDSQSAEQQGGEARASFPLLSGLQQLCESLWSSKQAQTPAQT